MKRPEATIDLPTQTFGSLPSVPTATSKRVIELGEKANNLKCCFHFILLDN